MSDPELEKLRKQRLAQLQSEYKTGNSNQSAQAAKAEQLKAQEDATNSILSQILDQPARARLNTLMLGKPEKGKLVQNMLVRMAQMGQISTKIGEKELIGFLENVNNQSKGHTTVKFDRRRAGLDSDDEDDL